MEGIRRESSDQWRELSNVLYKSNYAFIWSLGREPLGEGQCPPPPLPEPGEKLDPQKLIGFGSGEAHVATTGALVTWGAGRTWPSHLVWCLANPVASGREKVRRRQGQRTVNAGSLQTRFQISAPLLTGYVPWGKSHLQALVSSSVKLIEDSPSHREAAKIR